MTAPAFGPWSRSAWLIDSSRDVAVVSAAALAASNSLPVICSWSFCSSGFFSSSSEPCLSSPCGLVAMRCPANMLPTVIASRSFLVLPSR